MKTIEEFIKENEEYNKKEIALKLEKQKLMELNKELDLSILETLSFKELNQLYITIKDNLNITMGMEIAKLISKKQPKKLRKYPI